MVPTSDAQWQRLLHEAAVSITEARAAGNTAAEIHYRKEFQRLTILHSQWISGQAIKEMEFTLRDYIPTLPQLGFAGGMMIPLLILGGFMFMGASVKDTKAKVKRATKRRLESAASRLR